jgi:pimeloyl-ACP methyl ester carboxylesterase
MRVLRVVLPAVVVAVSHASAVEAADPDRCRMDGVVCSRVTVPLDRTGQVPGSVSLLVQRFKARRPARPPLFVFASDPGAAATRVYGRRPDIDDGQRPIVLMDLRGTGGSGALRCPALQRQGIAAARAPAARACARLLGDSASHYSSKDSVDDVEAVRQSLGVPKIALLGDGFGAGIALAYARHYPDRVERIVLQSPRGPGAFDPLYRAGMRAAPGLLNALCRDGSCGNTSPVGDLTRLAARTARRALRGSFATGDGHRRSVIVRPFDIFALLADGGSDPFALARLPGEIHSAATGDPAPLLREHLWNRAAARTPAISPMKVSAGAAAAQICEDADLPWPAGTAEADRSRLARESVGALPPGTFGPFGSAAGLGSDAVRLCLGWPTAGNATRQQVGPISDIPALVLVGTASLLAPLGDASALAGQLPGSQLVAGTGFWEHPLLEDPVSCMSSALDDFLAGREAEDGCFSYLSVSAVPPPPRTLARVAPAGGGKRPQRTANAVRLTLRDGVRGLISLTRGRARRVVRVPGLRSGSYSFIRRRTSARETLLRLHRVSFVPGVRVSGSLRFTSGGIKGRLLVTGTSAARGILALRREVLHGELGGRAVRTALASEFLLDNHGVSNGY